MDTVCSTDDSMESVENLPETLMMFISSTSMLRSADQLETSELNYSNQAQQSTCPAVVRSAGEMGVSSTNDEEVVNADTATANVRDGPSFGISGGSIGMGASHEAEIHGTDASVHRADSVAGEVEAVAEITENQGQTGEFAPDPGLMGDYVPEEVDRGDRNGDSQDLTSRSVGRADSGSKIVGSAKAESIESGEKLCQTCNLCSRIVLTLFFPAMLLSVLPMKHPKRKLPKIMHQLLMIADSSSQAICLTTGPPIGESNYEEAGSSGSSSSNTGAVALCGWQLTLDALDSFQSLGHVPVQTVESESAASLYKSLARHSLANIMGITECGTWRDLQSGLGPEMLKYPAGQLCRLGQYTSKLSGKELFFHGG
ncbi:hypothetical protein HAX54_017426 [Datura stramonium]|uniref:Uncharacterized protein n=1 Tax=Datura stramonium TaxID=4076 RepID=A0ABS8UMZ3_DATST|nr:hypothetical protein [Datura stramonium]